MHICIVVHPAHTRYSVQHTRRASASARAWWMGHNLTKQEIHPYKEGGTRDSTPSLIPPITGNTVHAFYTQTTVRLQPRTLNHRLTLLTPPSAFLPPTAVRREEYQLTLVQILSHSAVAADVTMT
jgi:hypothetical protein